MIDDSATNGVPEMHFRFWRRADQTAREEYLEGFRSSPDEMAWFGDGYLGDDPDFDALLGMPAHTLGFQYAQHIADNNLSQTLARDYRNAHESLDAAGRLDDMPVEVKYAVVRGFQIHDYFHIHGWQRGRAARNLNYTRWEERLSESVDDLRAEYGLAA